MHDGDVRCALKFEDVAVLVGEEVFIVEVHELPGRAAILSKQLAAGRLRPPPHECTVILRGGGSKAVRDNSQGLGQGRVKDQGITAKPYPADARRQRETIQTARRQHLGLVGADPWGIN